MHISTYRSELGTIMRADNPALRTALEQLPEVTRVDAQLEALVDHAKAIPPIQTEHEIFDDVVSGLSSGEGLPDDLVHRVAESQLAAHGWGATKTLLERAAASILGKRDRALRNGSETLTASLHDQLTELLTEAEDLADAPSNAADAVAQDQVDLFQAAAAAGQRYRDIRQAQGAIMRHLWADGEWEAYRAWWASAVVISDPVTVFERWPHWHRDGYLIDGHGHRKWLEPPWPDPKPASLEEHFTWLIRNPAARGWVPTKAQLDARIDELRDLMRPPESTSSYTVRTGSDASQLRPAETRRAPRGAYGQAVAKDWSAQ